MFSPKFLAFLGLTLGYRLYYKGGKTLHLCLSHSEAMAIFWTNSIDNFFLFHQFSWMEIENHMKGDIFLPKQFLQIWSFYFWALQFQCCWYLNLHFSLNDSTQRSHFEKNLMLKSKIAEKSLKSIWNRWNWKEILLKRFYY